MPDLLRVESNERLDIDDFRHVIEDSMDASMRHIQSQFMTNPSGQRSWIIHGFDISNPSAQNVQVTRGAAIVPRKDGSQIHYGVLAAEGDATKVVDISTYSTGTYNIYIKFEYVDGDNEARIFWNPSGAGTEYSQTISTRKQANWSLRVESTSPGGEWFKIGEVARATMTITDQRDFYFEGDVSTSYGHTWGDGTNDRDDDRSQYGIGDMQTFVSATRRKFADLQGRDWWKESICNSTLPKKMEVNDFLDANYLVSGHYATNPSALNISVNPGVAYVDGIRVELSEATGGTYDFVATDNKDTYVDLENDGTFVLTEVNNGAGAPAIQGIRLWKVAVVSSVVTMTDLRPTNPPEIKIASALIGTNNDPKLHFYEGATKKWTFQHTGSDDRFSISDNSGNKIFIIEQGAPANSLFIETTTGDVGIGTASPEKSLHVNGNAIINDSTYSANSIEINLRGTGDRTSYIDFHSTDTTYTDNALRIIRYSGDNGPTHLVHRGTGNLLFHCDEAASIIFQTNSTNAFVIETDRQAKLTNNLIPGDNKASLYIDSFYPSIELNDKSASASAFRLAVDATSFEIIGDVANDGTFEWNAFELNSATDNFITIKDDSNVTRFQLFGNSSVNSFYKVIPDTNGDSGLYCYDSNGSSNFSIQRIDTDGSFRIRQTGSDRFFISSGGKIGLGGESAPDCSDGGLTSRVASNGLCFTMKGSSVSKTLTGIESDTAAIFRINGGTVGGLNINGYSGGSVEAINMTGVLQGAATTTELTTSVGIIHIKTYDSNFTAPATDDNMLTIASGNNTRFIFKGNGDLYVNGSSPVATYDNEQDALACQDLAYAMANKWDKILAYNKTKLEELGIISNDFISYRKSTALQLGAIGELYQIVDILCNKLGLSYENLRQAVRNSV